MRSNKEFVESTKFPKFHETFERLSTKQNFFATELNTSYGSTTNYHVAGWSFVSEGKRS